MGDVVQERGRIGTKLATQLDSDGKLVQFDIREDEEQNVKLQETIELLLVAGYFRARIKGLSVFDKVVGGMVWCISQCDLDVDVDILYSENSSIGQKIALTEKIVAILPKMKCPYSIEPHQIQGLDFIHVFPVIQWLVKKTIESRAEVEDDLKNYACHLFESTANDSQESTPQNIQARNFQKFQSSLYPERYFRRLDYTQDMDENEAIKSSLFEYRASQSNLTPGDSEENSGGDLNTGLTPVKSLTVGATKLSSSTVASLIDAQNIQKVVDEYKNKEFTTIVEENREPNSNDKQTQIERLKTRLESLRSSRQNTEVKIETMTGEIEKICESNKEMQSEMAEFERLEREIDPKVYKELLGLKEQYDKIKEFETQFKNKCKGEVEALERELQKLEDLSMNGPEDISKLEQKNVELNETLRQKRLQVAEINKKVAKLQRALDEEPSRAELNQYTKRFMELYNQVASNHRETKQFYTLYNTLIDVRTLMQWQNSVSDSVSSEFPNALSSEHNRIQYTNQLQSIVEKVHDRKIKAERSQTEKRMERDLLSEQYQELLDQQRLYHKTVADFKQECRRNEELTQQLTNLQ